MRNGGHSGRTANAAAPVHGRIFLAAALACTPLAAHPEAWVTRGIVDLTGSYDSNLRLTTGPHDDVFATYLSTEFQAQRLTEVSELRGQVILNFFDDSGDEANDESNTQSLAFRARREGERQRVGIDGEYFRDTTIRGVLSPDLSAEPDADVVEEELPPDADTGIVDVEVRRNRVNLRPFWSWYATERTETRLEYGFTSVEHDETLGTTLQDFDQHTIAPSIAYGISETDTLHARLEASRYRTTTGPDQEADTYVLSGGYERRFSETFRAGVEAGLFYASFEGPGQDGDDTGVVFAVSGNQRLEAGRWRARLERRLYPSGTGQVVRTDQLVFDVRRAVTARLGTSLEGRVFKTDSLGTSRGSDRTYFALSPRVSWNFTRDLRGDLWYRYRTQERDADDERADSHAIFVGISYVLGGGP